IIGAGTYRDGRTARRRDERLHSRRRDNAHRLGDRERAVTARVERDDIATARGLRERRGERTTGRGPAAWVGVGACARDERAHLGANRERAMIRVGERDPGEHENTENEDQKATLWTHRF